MNTFSNLSKTAQVMLAAVCIVCFVLLILGLIVINLIYPFEIPLRFTTGIVIGCIHSAFKVVLLEKSIRYTIDLEKEHAINISRLHSLGRVFLTAAVFVIVIVFPEIFGIYGAAIGVLSLQPAAFITNIIVNKIN